MLRSVRQARSVPSLRQQRALASSVLLTSWKEARVPELKEELKKRGLSTIGRKSDLLNRLNQHEISQTKPTTRAASTVVGDKPASLTDAQIKDVSKETVSFEAGQKVSTQVREGVKTAEELGESPTESPGLPQNPHGNKPATFDFHLPEFKDEPEPGTPVPWILAFHSDKFPSSKSSPSQAASIAPHVPKLFTAADASTHLGGGPSAALNTRISTDPLATDAELSSSDSSRTTLNPAERKGLYVLAGALVAALGLGAVVNPSQAKKLAREGEHKVEALSSQGKAKAEEVLKEGKAKGKQAVDAVKEKTVGK